MSATKRILLLALLAIAMLGVLGIAVGYVLGADPIQIGRALAQNAFERLQALWPGVGKLLTVF